MAIVGRLGRYKKKKVYIKDKIPYFELPPFPLYYTVRECNLIQNLKIPVLYNSMYYRFFHNPKKFISKFMDVQKIDLVHDHSSGNISKATYSASKEKKIPFLYEVRGFVEESNVANRNLTRDDKRYIEKRQRKTNLMKKADAVITLGKAMKNEIIKRGIKKKKISIIPNGVNTKYFSPLPPTESLKEKLKIGTDKVIGYIGSIRKLEGLEVLIKSVSILKKTLGNVKVLLVGPIRPRHYEARFKRFIRKSSIKDDIIISGIVPFNEIKKYYSIIDIFVIPRLNLKVNRLVTPLKPLEVMAMEKLLIASDLPALREQIIPKVSGVLFEPENPTALSKKLEYYLNNQDKLERIGKNARDYVKKHYEWKKIVKKYLPIYEKLMEDRR
ncbi:MAG: glycosyltransferase family 4 protein [Promethearchaeia archaeon]